jgi:ELWxxDGT repeat protein
MIRQTMMFSGSAASNIIGLWESNGTVAGTYELTGISGALGEGIFDDRLLGTVADFTVFNGEVLFDGADTNNLQGLWVTNGTAAGTSELTGISGANPIFDGLRAEDMTVFNSEVFFNGEEPPFLGATPVYGLWVTDGTAAGTHELTGISGALSGAGGVDPLDLTWLGSLRQNELLFDGTDANNTQGLWVTNGMAAGTSELTGISGADPNGLAPTDMTVFPRTLLFAEVLFVGSDASLHPGLWVTDGTAAGTQELTGISGTAILGGGLEPTNLTVFNREVLFSGTDVSGVRGLWVTNGSAAGTHEITGITGGSPNGILFGVANQEFKVFNGEVLFAGMDATGNRGLWVTIGTAAGTSELTGIAGASSGGIFNGIVNSTTFGQPDFTILHGEVLFEGMDASGMPGLWVTDGTAAGTHELMINNARNSGLDPRSMASVTLTIPPLENFNSNNTSDILFRNNSTGDTWFEAMSGGAFAGWNQIGSSDTTYSVVGIGDFFGTGTSDILFRNNSTGDTWFEAISNGAFAGWHQVGGSDTNYSVVGIGDFYASGTSDILFRNNSTGDTWIEAISNGAFASWHQVGGSSTSYAVVGLGDFDSDGTDDILFRNNATGDTWYAAMSNGALASWHQIGGSDTNFAVVGVGDFYGSGTDDILFRNNSTGDTWFEAISNGAFAGWHQVGGSDTSYAVVGIGDYFGNNSSDILFRNTSTGDTWFEQITNGAFAGWNQIGGSSTSYSVPVTVGPPALT